MYYPERANGDITVIPRTLVSTVNLSSKIHHEQYRYHSNVSHSCTGAKNSNVDWWRNQCVVYWYWHIEYGRIINASLYAGLFHHTCLKSHISLLYWDYHFIIWIFVTNMLPILLHFLLVVEAFYRMAHHFSAHKWWRAYIFFTRDIFSHFSYLQLGCHSFSIIFIILIIYYIDSRLMSSPKKSASMILISTI